MQQSAARLLLLFVLHLDAAGRLSAAKVKNELDHRDVLFGGWPLVSPLAGWKQETTGARIRFLSEATIYVRIDLSPINL